MEELLDVLCGECLSKTISKSIYVQCCLWGKSHFRIFRDCHQGLRKQIAILNVLKDDKVEKIIFNLHASLIVPLKLLAERHIGIIEMDITAKLLPQWSELQLQRSDASSYFLNTVFGSRGLALVSLDSIKDAPRILLYLRLIYNCTSAFRICPSPLLCSVREKFKKPSYNGATCRPRAELQRSRHLARWLEWHKARVDGKTIRPAWVKSST